MCFLPDGSIWKTKLTFKVSPMASELTSGTQTRIPLLPVQDLVPVEE